MRVEALSTVVATLESGKRPKGGASGESGTIPSLGGEHLNNDGGFRLDNLKYIEEQFFADLRKGAIKTNDILIVKDGATTGKVSYVGSDFPFERAAINEHLFALTVDSKIASPRYVFSFLKSPQGQKEILKDFRGAAIGGISRGFVDLTKIPLPPLDDQIRIAHLLGKVEGLIAQRKQHLQQLDDQLKSIFLEMFGDPVRNDKGWDKPDFDAIISSMRNGLSPSKAGTHKGCVYTLSAITGNRFQEIHKEDTFSQIHEKYFPMANDFLICRGNGNLGLVGKGYFFPGISKSVIFPDTIIAVSIRPETINKSFFEALWKTRFIRQQIESNARTTNGAHKINQGVIEKIKIIQPPVDLQNQFASIVKKVESLKSQYQQSLTDLENLYGALSQQAFKGELDLSRVPLPEDDEAPQQPGQSHEQQVTSASFQLPEPPENGELLSAENRQSLIEFWLNAWFQHYIGEPFSATAFSDTAYRRLVELSERKAFRFDDPDHGLDKGQWYEEPAPFGTPEYDHINRWMFEALAAGKLKQSLDGNQIQIVLPKRPVDWGTW